MLRTLSMPFIRSSYGGGAGRKLQGCGSSSVGVVICVAVRRASPSSTAAAAAAPKPSRRGRVPPLSSPRSSPLLQLATNLRTRTFSSSVSSSSPPPPETLQGVDWIDNPTQTYKIFTDNQFTTVPPPSSEAKPLMQVRNPANQQLIGIVPDTSDALLDDVVHKAVKAFEEWKLVPVQQRQRVFLDYVQLIKEHKQTLAELICMENGKTIADAHGDVFRGLEVAETAAHVAPSMLGDALMNISNHMDCTSYRVPLGVCSAICPFNFPAMIPLWSFPLAVACGNTFVLKPSEKTPSAALLLAQLTAQAGLPPNVLQVVHGGVNTVERICRHPEIKSVSFVGGNQAGEFIYQEATTHGKRAQCNMGAKNHAVVLEDADISATVRALVGAGFGAAGQRCMALSVVVLVGDTTADVYLSQLVEQAKQLRVGVGWDPDADIGPLITAQSKERVHRIIEEAVQQGAVVHLDGRTHQQSMELSHKLGGNFVGPTLLEVNDMNNAAYAEEIFGPVLVCVRIQSLEDAIHLVNANRYGNGVALFTKSGGAARQFVNQIEAGQVGINTPIPVPLPMFSFTGNKASIRGDVNFYGASGVHFFTQLKTVTTNWPPPAATIELGGVNMPTMGGGGGGSKTPSS